MIKSITLKFGRASSLAAEKLQAAPITVFVGPNNSGKSKVLAEINQFCHQGTPDSANVILDSLELKSLTALEAEERVNAITLSPLPGEGTFPDRITIGKGTQRHQLPKLDLLKMLQNANLSPQPVCAMFLRLQTLMLNGRHRIELVQNQPAGDLQKPPQNSLQVLFRDDIKRAEVRRMIHDAFGAYFVIDPTQLGTLRIRLSSRAPLSEIEEKGIHDEAIRFHAAALPMEATSDGVKASSGIVIEIVAGDPGILLIDEPEAFLHPALSYKLGKEIALASSHSEKRLFVSTHSSSFVRGCIQSGAPVNIVRLTYRDNVATARLLPNDEILRLMRNPLLRSTGVIGALFYEFVVVTESDSDRAFYEEVNERLLRFQPELGIPNCLFINAQNKQTVKTIIKPLRELGIPTAGVVDVDVLKDGGSVWTSLLDAASVPPIEQSPFGNLRSALKQSLESTGKDMKRDGGIELLPPSEREAAQNLFDRLAEYGLLVVPNGELESWLKNLGVSGHGPNWLIDMFEKMGEDPESPSYLKPENGDVWKFVGGIKKWLTNPSRKGIPN